MIVFVSDKSIFDVYICVVIFINNVCQEDKNNNMATIKFVLYKSNKRKDGSYPVCLRVSKKVSSSTLI